MSVHEFGHFWVARRLGFKVLRFSIGFGRPLLVWRGRAAGWHGVLAVDDPARRLREDARRAREAGRGRRAGPRFQSAADLAAHRRAARRSRVQLPVRDRRLLADVHDRRAGHQSGDRRGQPRTRSPHAPASRRTTRSRRSAAARRRLGKTRRSRSSTSCSPRRASTSPFASRTARRKNVQLDVRGRDAELTEPAALYNGLGILPGPVVPAVIDAVTPDSAAAAAGLQAGDEVSASATADRSWDQWVEFIRKRPGQSVTVDIHRGGDDSDQRSASRSARSRRTARRSAASARRGRARLPASVIESSAGRAALRRVRVAAARRREDLGDECAHRAHAGATWWSARCRSRTCPDRSTIADGTPARALRPASRLSSSFLAVVSISLGIMNLLPIPMFDGGQVVYQIAEWFKGSPLSERALVARSADRRVLSDRADELRLL